MPGLPSEYLKGGPFTQTPTLRTTRSRLRIAVARIDDCLYKFAREASIVDALWNPLVASTTLASKAVPRLRSPPSTCKARGRSIPLHGTLQGHLICA
ncbi:hypothetical protein MASR2M8_15160 [Opitutaceae bacterium]